MSTSLRLVRLGRHHGPPDEAARTAAAAAALTALQVDTLLAHDELSVGQLERRLVVDRDRLADVLDEAEISGLVRFRDGRYSLTRAGELLRSRRPTEVPLQRRTTFVG